MKMYVCAMAINQSDLKNQLYSVAGPITEHLIKLYLFPNSEYISHWRKEVWSFLHNMPKLKNTNKLPSQKLILDCISIYLDQISDLIDVWIDEYSSLSPVRINSEEAENIVYSYLNWISDRLSGSASLTSKEVYQKLDELGL